MLKILGKGYLLEEKCRISNGMAAANYFAQSQYFDKLELT